MESSLSRFEEQCTTVFNACQDRRPKKGFSLFVCFVIVFTHLQNKKEQSGTDVPPPIWVHPDYIFNADAMITQMKQIRDISEAGMHSRLHDASLVCSNQHHAQQSTLKLVSSSFFLFSSFFSFSSILLFFFLSFPLLCASTLRAPTRIAIGTATGTATGRPPPRFPASPGSPDCPAPPSASPALSAAWR